jgi:hypothetical protein
LQELGTGGAGGVVGTADGAGEADFGHGFDCC